MLVLVAWTLLAGCFDMKSEIHINPDGSGTAAVGYAIMQGILNGGPFDEYLAKDGGADLIDRSVLLKKIDDRDGISVTNLDLWRENDMQYIRLHMNFDEIDNLGEKNVEYSWELKDGFWIFRVVVKKGNTVVPDPRLHKPILSGFKDQGFHFKVHLPYRIVDSNADEVNWNVAEFSVPLTFFFQNEASTKVLYAKAQASNWDRFKAWINDLFG